MQFLKIGEAFRTFNGLYLVEIKFENPEMVKVLEPRHPMDHIITQD